MTFRDLTDIIGPLELPIRGKTYTLPVVSSPNGAKILAASQGKSELTDAQIRKILLGGVEKTMTDDGLTSFDIDRVLWTALADVQRGRAVAEIVWENGIDPKALTETASPNRAARRSKPSAAANTTKRPASTSTTKKA
jgi:hypothetical protein